jgi:hypothetical protein
MRVSKKAKLLELVEYLDTCAWMLERAYTHDNTNPQMTKGERIAMWTQARARTLKEAKDLIG